MKPKLDAIREHHKAFLGSDPFKIKQATIKTPNVDRSKRLVSGTVSAAVPDMDGEVVLPDGLDFSYFPKSVKSVYFSHNYDDMPVGTCRNLAVRDGGKSLFATTYILDNERGNDLLTAMEAGAVNGFSIGFKATDYGSPSIDEVMQYGDCNTIIREGVLIEYSITPMPACPAALVEMVSKGLIHRSSAVAFGLKDAMEVKTPRTIVVLDDEVTIVRKRSNIGPANG